MVDVLVALFGVCIAAFVAYLFVFPWVVVVAIAISKAYGSRYKRRR